jgi:hypothetical protein
MDADIEFKSSVPTVQRAALEALVFFNTCQGRVSDCIAEAIEQFGSPEIVTNADRLTISIGAVTEVQSLFAIEKRSGRPVGLAVYLRPDLEHITVLHLCIASEYVSGGPRASEQLLLRLLKEVRRSTRRVKGIRRLELYYLKGRSASQRWRLAAKAAV